MKHCYECGTLLENKFLEHEGMIPFCKKCNEFRFPIFSSAVSMIITNLDESKFLLVKQYGKDFYRFVAGYTNKGESAEEALERELMEEVSLKAISYKPLKTSYFGKSNTLMINYLVKVNDLNVKPNYEIDSYAWIDRKDVLTNLEDAKLAYEFFKFYLSR